MCKGFEEHIHVIRENDEILYSTTCTECFHKLLNDPDVWDQISTKK